MRPIQSEALAAIEEEGAGLFSIGVGWGKTLIGFLAASAAGAGATIYLCPASTLAQAKAMYQEAKQHFRLKPCVFIPYSRLSRPEGTSMLETTLKELRRDEGVSEDSVIMVADEAHKIQRLTSARTKRVMRFLEAHPRLRFVAMSGTLTSKSIKDMAGLAELALGEGSPVPRKRLHLDAWAECLDVNGQPNPRQWDIVTPLWSAYNTDSIINVYGRERRRRMRESFQKRFRSAPGVVASEVGALGCSLEVASVRNLSVPSVVQEAIALVTEEDESPNGEVLPDDISKWRVLRQLSNGFYYRWVWPNDEVDEDWMSSRNRWNRQVRIQLERNAEEGYDSPLLVANRIRQEVERGASDEIHRAWLSWFDSGQSGKPSPPVETVWLSDYVLDYIDTWIDKHKGGTVPLIIWYESRAMGEALITRQRMGVYGPGVEVPAAPVTCAMSIRAHGIGKNLQGWAKQLIVSPPSGGKAWEQLLGRTHRPGQQADVVEAHVLQHTESFTTALRKAKEDAYYIEQATGSRQKLCYCTYTN